MTVTSFVKHHPRYAGNLHNIKHTELKQLLNFEGTIIVISSMQYTRYQHLYSFSAIAKETYGADKVTTIITHSSVRTPKARYIFVLADSDYAYIYGYARGPVVFINNA